MVEGLYRGWDELRSVPSGQQSGLRVIVLFTDGASNSVPGELPAARACRAACARTTSRRTCPTRTARRGTTRDIRGSTTRRPAREPERTTSRRRTGTARRTPCAQVPRICRASFHHGSRSAGIPTTFPLQTSSADRQRRRAERQARAARIRCNGAGRIRPQVFNINNAARNLVEIIANAARNDIGDYRIRIYTIGMGELVRYNLGTIPETSESILMRVANDKRLAGLQRGAARGQVLLRRDGRRRGPGVPGAPERDHPSEQVAMTGPRQKAVWGRRASGSGRRAPGSALSAA